MTTMHGDHVDVPQPVKAIAARAGIAEVSADSSSPTGSADTRPFDGAVAVAAVAVAVAAPELADDDEAQAGDPLGQDATSVRHLTELHEGEREVDEKPTPSTNASSVAPLSSSSTIESFDGDAEVSLAKRRRLSDDMASVDDTSRSSPPMTVEAPAATSPLFLEKTYELLDTCAPALAAWSATGDSFVVKNPTIFAEQVIPVYFKHKNFSSFVRQLNFYGFRKVRVVSSAATGGVDPKDWWEFRHDKFLCGRRDLLCEIKRRPMALASATPASASPDGSPTESGSAAPTNDLSRGLIDRDEVDELRAEVSSLRDQIQQLNKHMLGVMQIIMSRDQSLAAAPPVMTSQPPFPAQHALTGVAGLPHQYMPQTMHVPNYLHALTLPPPGLSAPTTESSMDSRSTLRRSRSSSKKREKPSGSSKLSSSSSTSTSSTSTSAPGSDAVSSTAAAAATAMAMAMASSGYGLRPMPSMVGTNTPLPNYLHHGMATSTTSSGLTGSASAGARIDWEAYHRQQFEYHQRLLHPVGTMVGGASTGHEGRLASRKLSTQSSSRRSRTTSSSSAKNNSTKGTSGTSTTNIPSTISTPAVTGLKRPRNQARTKPPVSIASAATADSKASTSTAVLTATSASATTSISHLAALQSTAELNSAGDAVRQLSRMVTQIRGELLLGIIARILEFVKTQPANETTVSAPAVDAVADAVGSDIQQRLVQINAAEASTLDRSDASGDMPSETALMYRVEILKFVSKELPRAVVESVEKRLPLPVKKALNRSLLALLVQKAQGALEHQMRLETSASSPSASNGSDAGAAPPTHW